MEVRPVGKTTERFYGNVDVPDGGYVGNEGDKPRIVFDHTNERIVGYGEHTFGDSASGIRLPHMQQSDSTSQTVATANVAQVVTFDTDVHSLDITRTSSSRFTIQYKGSYLIAISAVCDTDAGQSKDIELWLRVNGSDVANSNTILHLTATNETILAVTFIQHFDVNDYFEFWMTGEANDVRILATAAVATPGEERPACPSIIMTCTYAGID